jgi:hypothetical protein
MLIDPGTCIGMSSDENVGLIGGLKFPALLAPNTDVDSLELMAGDGPPAPERAA